MWWRSAESVGLTWVLSSTVPLNQTHDENDDKEEQESCQNTYKPTGCSDVLLKRLCKNIIGMINYIILCYRCDDTKLMRYLLCLLHSISLYICAKKENMPCKGFEQNHNHNHTIVLTELPFLHQRANCIIHNMIETVQ